MVLEDEDTAVAGSIETMETSRGNKKRGTREDAPPWAARLRAGVKRQLAWSLA